VLTGRQLTERHPAYHLPDDMMALFQPEGGFLLSERCIVAHVMLAMASGAEIHGREKVLDWQPLADGVRVTTDRATYEADKLVISAGAWAGQLVESLAELAVPERQVLAWLQPTRQNGLRRNDSRYLNLVVDEGRYYGFPVFSVPGFKFGRTTWTSRLTPDTIDREGHPRDEQILRAFAEKYFPTVWGDNGAQGVHVHQLAGRALHPRPASRLPQVSSQPGSPGTATSFAASSAKSWPICH
jgi:sarcosine oxidase